MGLYYKIAEVDGKQVLLFSNNRKKLKQYAEDHKEDFDFHNRIRKGSEVVVAETNDSGDLEVFDEMVDVDEDPKEEKKGVLERLGM